MEAHGCSWPETTCPPMPGEPNAIAATKFLQAAPGIPGIRLRSSRTHTFTSASGGTSRRGWRGCTSMSWCWTPTSSWRTTRISSSSRCTLSHRLQRTALLSVIVRRRSCRLSSGALRVTTKLCLPAMYSTKLRPVTQGSTDGPFHDQEPLASKHLILQRDAWGIEGEACTVCTRSGLAAFVGLEVQPQCLNLPLLRWEHTWTCAMMRDAHFVHPCSCELWSGLFSGAALYPSFTAGCQPVVQPCWWLT